MKLIKYILSLIWGTKQHTPMHLTETERYSHIPFIKVEESEYIKTKRQECIEKYEEKLINTNPERKVDLCRPIILRNVL